MVTQDPRPALEALASEHGLSILRFLRGRDWTLASAVAEGLRIHTTTASKHLAAFQDAGFLERQAYASKRPTFVYRLRTDLIRIEFDLAESAEPVDASAVAAAFVDALLSATQRVGGARIAQDLVESIFGATRDWRRALRERFARPGDARIVLDALVADSRNACASLVGTATAARLLRLALDEGFEGRQDLLPQVNP